MPSQNKKEFILGTRGSPLALAQARQVQALFPCTLKIIQTSGDRFQGERLATAGGKGLFVKEIEEALLNKEIDFAVHSLKDVPGILPQEFILAAFLKREDCRDVFISRAGTTWKQSAAGLKIGTSSPRREVLLRQLRPDWNFVPIRGNVDTRLRKVAQGEFDGTVLAAAGLNRLGLAEHLKNFFTTEEMLPALCQGIVALETRREDKELIAALRTVCNDSVTAVCATAERAFLAGMGGDCTTPLAGLATLEKNQLTLKGWLASPDGSHVWQNQISGDAATAEELGSTLAKRILSCAS